jgi:hypothetical protein
MNEKLAIAFATEQGVTVCDNKRDKQLEWIKLIKGDDIITVQRSISEKGNCWGVYGSLVPRASYDHSEFQDMRLGLAIERAVELLAGWYK